MCIYTQLQLWSERGVLTPHSLLIPTAALHWTRVSTMLALSHATLSILVALSDFKSGMMPTHAIVAALQTGSAAAPAPQFVKTISNTSVKSVTPAATSSSNSSSSTTTTPCMYDVVVAGGTLGVFIAAALAAKGWRVAVVERGILAGRTQEWNISRKELKELEEVTMRQASVFFGAAVKQTTPS